MSFIDLRKLKAFFLILFRRLWRFRGLWFRSLLCLLIAFLFLKIDPDNNDIRFFIRGPFRPSPNIYLLNFSFNEWSLWKRQEVINPTPPKAPVILSQEKVSTPSNAVATQPPHDNQLPDPTTSNTSLNNSLISSHSTTSSFSFQDSPNEFISPQDSEFWDTKAWYTLLKDLLQYHPKLIIVSFLFTDLEFPMTPDQQSVFGDKHILWAAKKNYEGHVLLPQVSLDDASNVGLLEAPQRSQNILMTEFQSPLVHIPSLALMASRKLGFKINYITGQKKIINYQGPQGTYKTFDLSQLQKPSMEDLLRNKIIIIGSQNNFEHLVDTPVGPLNRSELEANLLDNVTQSLWIRNAPKSLTYFLSLLILSLSIYFILYMPSSSAFIIYVGLLMIYTSFSIWLFDENFLRIPVLPIAIQLLVTYLIFLSYKLTVRDYQNWQLGQEHKYLIEIERLKSNFVSLFSHDLKTPIAKIQAICDRLLQQNVSENIKNDLSNLRKESSELHRYIQTILQISKVESKDFHIKKEATDINELIEEVRGDLIPLLERKNQRLQLNLEPLFSVEVDPILIKEVLLNLVENSIKYCPEGATIDIRSLEEEDTIILHIKDNGPGIPTSEHKNIFEKFYRPNEEKHKTKGTGLGLYLVKYFIELHGGKLDLISEVGRGTEFIVYLPIDG